MSKSHRIPFWSSIIVWAFAALTACKVLTPTEGAALDAGYVLGCAGLSAIPYVGGLLAGACTGEEGTVQAAIDNAVASSGASLPDGGAPVLGSSAVVPAVSAQTLTLGPALTIKRNGRRKMIGTMPPELSSLAPTAQKWLDANPDYQPPAKGAQKK
jgi:hypothetical protein